MSRMSPGFVVDGPVLTVGAGVGAAEGPDGCWRTEGSQEGCANVCTKYSRARWKEVHDELEGAEEAEATVMKYVNYKVSDR